MECGRWKFLNQLLDQSILTSDSSVVEEGEESDSPPPSAEGPPLSSTIQRTSSSSSSSSMDDSSISPKTTIQKALKDMDETELRKLGKSFLIASTRQLEIPMPKTQTLQLLAQNIHQSFHGNSLGDEEDLIEKITSVTTEGTGTINSFYVNNFKPIDRCDQYANKIRPDSKVIQDPQRVMALFVVLAMGVNTYSICNEARAVGIEKRLPIKEFIKKEVEEWIQTRKMMKT